MNVDYLVLFFLWDVMDVNEVCILYEKVGGKGGIIVKIECVEVVVDNINLDQIIFVLDGVMVVCGDLVIEIGDVELVGV